MPFMYSVSHVFPMALPALNATNDLHLHKFHSAVSEDIQRNIYADNIVCGCGTEIQYYTHASKTHNESINFQFTIKTCQ